MKAILVHSVYHIFYALSIAEKVDFKNIVIICSTSNPKKFHQIIEIIFSQFLMNVIMIEHDDKASKISTEDLEKIKSIDKLLVDEFVIFNQDNLLAIYLAKSFKKKGSLVSLAQDGMKAYANIKKMALKYRVQRAFQSFNFFRVNGFQLQLFFVKLKYGNCSFIDKLYLSHPDLVTDTNKFKEKANLSHFVLSEFDNLLEGTIIDFQKHTIFYASQLLKLNEKQIEIEEVILNILARKFENFQKIIKVHPRVSNKVRERLNKLNDWIVIDDFFPGELLINRFNSSLLVFSGYSSLALFEPKESSSVKMFWLYPIYGKSLKVLTYTKIFHPSESIRIIKNFNEIENL